MNASTGLVLALWGLGPWFELIRRQETLQKIYVKSVIYFAFLCAKDAAVICYSSLLYNTSVDPRPRVHVPHRCHVRYFD